MRTTGRLISTENGFVLAQSLNFAAFWIWDYFAWCPTKCFPTLRQKYLIVSRQHLRKLHNRISSSSLQDFPSHFLISWSTLKDFPPSSVHLRDRTTPLHNKIKQKKLYPQWWLWCPLPPSRQPSPHFFLSRVRWGAGGAANQPIAPLCCLWYTQLHIFGCFTRRSKTGAPRDQMCSVLS